MKILDSILPCDQARPGYDPLRFGIRLSLKSAKPNMSMDVDESVRQKIQDAFSIKTPIQFLNFEK
jgi:hypothetical protein